MSGILGILLSYGRMVSIVYYLNLYMHGLYRNVMV